MLKRDFIPAFNRGLGQSNQLAVIADKSDLHLYLNGQFVTSANDNTLTHGQIGVTASTNEKPTRVTYSNAQVWEL